MCSHYYSQVPYTKYDKRYRFIVQVRGIQVTIESLSGVFSARKLDSGTRLLLEKMIVKDGWKILDLGCGYGIIGIVAAKLAPNGKVVLIDVNKRAVMLARHNIALNKISNAKVYLGDLYNPVRGEKFNTIITNPPQSAGWKIVKKIVEEAPRYLETKGILQVVARHRKGGSRIFNLMKEFFYETKILGSRGGYKVYAGWRD